MKILWFVNVPMPAMYRVVGKGQGGYGGHWMTALLEQLKYDNNIEIGIVTAYPGLKDCQFSEDGMYYYVIGQPKKFHAFAYRKSDLENCYSAIEDFQPDVIHFHGSERFYGLVKVVKNINIPSVVSIQGILKQYSIFHNYFGILNPFDIIKSTRLAELLSGFGMIWDYKRIVNAAKRERNILKNVEGLIGRTTWDCSFAKLYNPEAAYFHVGEILRSQFYCERWALEKCDEYSLIYTNAGHPRRGTENLLMAVSLLKNEFPDIKLRLAGTVSKRSGYGRFLRKLINKLGIVEQVDFLGYLNGSEMVRELLRSHVFIIASYIENSPNSLAEAMMLGMPCAASYVGGIPSMIDNGRTGLLFPAGDVPLLADCIRRSFKDASFAKMLGENARLVAATRHAPTLVVKQLLDAYKKLLSL
ncbi:MAG: glycosyltransferase family 4 protein [Clostridiales bacterium]|nr:glycosyltransferase family 4 protein [Clostridiales bacterium]